MDFYWSYTLLLSLPVFHALLTSVSYISQMEQHLPFKLMLFRLGNVCDCCLQQPFKNIKKIDIHWHRRVKTVYVQLCASLATFDFLVYWASCDCNSHYTFWFPHSKHCSAECPLRAEHNVLYTCRCTNTWYVGKVHNDWAPPLNRSSVWYSDTIETSSGLPRTAMYLYIVLPIVTVP